MTKDQILELAREADLIDFRDAASDPHVAQMVEFLQRFAALVATAEKWRGLALSKDGDGRCVQCIQQEAAEKEREACAALCDDIVQEEEGKLDRNYTREDTAEELAVLIRARNQPDIKS